MLYMIYGEDIANSAERRAAARPAASHAHSGYD
jgi:hypothetical protein